MLACLSWWSEGANIERWLLHLGLLYNRLAEDINIKRAIICATRRGFEAKIFSIMVSSFLREDGSCSIFVERASRLHISFKGLVSGIVDIINTAGTTRELFSIKCRGCYRAIVLE